MTDDCVMSALLKRKVHQYARKHGQISLPELKLSDNPQYDPCLIDLTRIKRGEFHDTRSFRAAIYTARSLNSFVIKSGRGMAFFDDLGPFVPELRIVYFPKIAVACRDGEGAWVTRIGDVVHVNSGRLYMTKKFSDVWLKSVRFLDPTHLKRLR